MRLQSRHPPLSRPSHNVQTLGVGVSRLDNVPPLHPIDDLGDSLLNDLEARSYPTLTFSVCIERSNCYYRRVSKPGVPLTLTASTSSLGLHVSHVVVPRPNEHMSGIAAAPVALVADRVASVASVTNFSLRRDWSVGQFPGNAMSADL